MDDEEGRGRGKEADIREAAESDATPEIEEIETMSTIFCQPNVNVNAFRPDFNYISANFRTRKKG